MKTLSIQATNEATAESEALNVPKHIELSVVCCMHNEQASIPLFFERLIPVLIATGLIYEIVCVNDGSHDDTLTCLKNLRNTVHGLRVLDLSRNFGKEAALTCGIDYAKGDAVIPIDADLQN